MSNRNVPSIVLLGPVGATFTYRAYEQIAPYFDAPALASGNVQPVTRNGGVIDALQQCRYGFGLIATETKIGGRINESLESFVKLGSRVGDPQNFFARIVGAARVPLAFALMARKGVRIGQIEGITAHPQALAACDAAIGCHAWTIEDSPSNGRAAEDVSKLDRYAKFAALGPIEAAEKYGLEVLDGSFSTGTTTFFLLTNHVKHIKTGKSNRALIVFRTKGKAGALVDVLQPFKEHGINMIHIHSVHHSNGIYDFVTEVECSDQQIESLEKACLVARSHAERMTAFGPFEVLDL